jgi:hypothetical protein
LRFWLLVLLRLLLLVLPQVLLARLRLARWQLLLRAVSSNR